MINFLIDLPAVVKVLTVFAAILIVNRIGINLGISILINTIVLCIWSGSSITKIVSTVLTLLKSENSLLLLAIVLLLFFTEALSSSGRMDKTIEGLKSLFPTVRGLYGGLPALVGLLPMPGGAIFSAPLVDSVDAHKLLNPVHKVALNYWFRHIWEYWWPLYPGVILAIRYSEIPAALFFAIQLPFTIAAATSGYFFLIRPIGVSTPMSLKTVNNHKGIGAIIVPIAFLVASSIIGSSLLPSLGVKSSIASIVALIVGLTIALAAIFSKSWHAAFISFRIFKSKKTWDMIFLVASIQLFSSAIGSGASAGETTLVSSMRDEFMAAGVPFILIAMFLPFISGFVTGIAFAFVGASFPLIFALLDKDAPLHIICATTSFAYGFGYLGMMLSPVHICFVVTNQYFRTNLFRTYKYLSGPVVVVAFAILVFSGIYYIIM